MHITQTMWQDVVNRYWENIMFRCPFGKRKTENMSVSFDFEPLALESSPSAVTADNHTNREWCNRLYLTTLMQVRQGNLRQGTWMDQPSLNVSNPSAIQWKDGTLSDRQTTDFWASFKRLERGKKKIQVVDDYIHGDIHVRCWVGFCHEHIISVVLVDAVFCVNQVRWTLCQFSILLRPLGLHIDLQTILLWVRWEKIAIQFNMSLRINIQ